jgi:hypothetical protein
MFVERLRNVRDKLAFPKDLYVNWGTNVNLVPMVKSYDAWIVGAISKKWGRDGPIVP